MANSNAGAAVGPTDDWPTFNAELSRKTTEQLQIWSDRYDKGTINLVTFLCIIGTLWDTTSGLIDRDLSTLIADIHRDLLKEARQR